MNFRLNITGGFPYSVAMFDSEPKSHIRSHGFPPCCQKTQEVQGQGGPSCCDAACWVVFLPAPVQKNKFQSHPPCLKKTLWVWDWAMIRSRFKDSHLVLQVSAFPRSNVGSRHTLKDSKRAFGIFCIGVFLVLCPGNLSSGAAHLFIAEFSHHSEECPVIRWTNAVGMYKPLLKIRVPFQNSWFNPLNMRFQLPGISGNLRMEIIPIWKFTCLVASPDMLGIIQCLFDDTQNSDKATAPGNASVNRHWPGTQGHVNLGKKIPNSPILAMESHKGNGL